MPTKTTTAAASGLSGALTTILLYVAYRLGWDMPNDVAVAIVVVLTVFVHWLTRRMELMTGRDLNDDGIVGNGHPPAAAPATTKGDTP